MKKNKYTQLTVVVIFMMVMFTTSVVMAAPPKHVHAKVAYSNKVTEGYYIKVDASALDTFTLNIVSSDDSSIYQIVVTGGSNLLPTLPLGKYTFELIDNMNEVVEKGKFNVGLNTPKPPKRDSTYVRAHVKGKYIGEALTFHVHADTSELFALSIIDSSGVVIYTLPVTGGTNDLPELPLGDYTFELQDANNVVVETGKFKIKPMHVHAHVKGKYTDEVLNFHIHADSTESFTLIIQDPSNVELQPIAVIGGDNLLPSLLPGRYTFILIDEDSNQVEKGKFSLKVRPVHTGIHPNPSSPGEGTIFVDAPESESFSLKIYDSSSLLIHSESIPGGYTSLPSLTTGIYFYKVVGPEGHEVSNGRIFIY